MGRPLYNIDDIALFGWKIRSGCSVSYVVYLQIAETYLIIQIIEFQYQTIAL